MVSVELVRRHLKCRESIVRKVGDQQRNGKTIRDVIKTPTIAGQMQIVGIRINLPTERSIRQQFHTFNSYMRPANLLGAFLNQNQKDAFSCPSSQLVKLPSSTDGRQISILLHHQQPVQDPDSWPEPQRDGQPQRGGNTQAPPDARGVCQPDGARSDRRRCDYYVKTQGRCRRGSGADH
mgnify:CR=1 FL=1